MEHLSKAVGKHITVHFTSSARGQRAWGNNGRVYPFPDLGCELVEWSEVGIAVADTQHGRRLPPLEEGGEDVVSETVTFIQFVPWSSIFSLSLDVEMETPTELELEDDLNAVGVLREIVQCANYRQALKYAEAYLRRVEEDEGMRRKMGGEK